MIRKNDLFSGMVTRTLLFVVTLVISGNATLISLNESATKIDQGTTVNMDVVASELDGKGVGAFDLTLKYDDGIFDFVAYSLSADLGNSGNPALDASGGNIMPGFVNLSGMALLPSEDLLKMQGDKVTLGTIQFLGKNPGESSVEFISTPLTVQDALSNSEVRYENMVGSANGEQFSLAGDYKNSSIIQVSSVNNAPPITGSVPEPSSIILSLGGLMALITCKLSRKKSV
jgi:hypothetical protein